MEALHLQPVRLTIYYRTFFFFLVVDEILHVHLYCVTCNNSVVQVN